jgi:hypothetical protein
MGPQVPYCVHKPLVLILSQAKSIQIPTPYFCTQIFWINNSIYTHTKFVVILCYWIHFHWTETRNDCQNNKMSTHMTWTAYCFQIALYLNHGSIFFSSIHFLDNIYIIMQNMLTCLVAHGFWLFTLQLRAFTFHRPSVLYLICEQAC